MVLKKTHTHHTPKMVNISINITRGTAAAPKRSGGGSGIGGLHTVAAHYFGKKPLLPMVFKPNPTAAVHERIGFTMPVAQDGDMHPEAFPSPAAFNIY